MVDVGGVAHVDVVRVFTVDVCVSVSVTVTVKSVVVPASVPPPVIVVVQGASVEVSGMPTLVPVPTSVVELVDVEPPT